jgi:hypothetical protein
MYMDDLLLISSTYEHLSEMMEILNDFLLNHSAVANEDKLNLFTSRKIDDLDKSWAKERGIFLPTPLHFEYLGHIIESGSAVETKRIIKKIWKKFHSMKNLGIRWGEVDPLLELELVKRSIIPIIESEAQIRSLPPSSHKEIDRTIANLVKIILRLPKASPTVWVLWESGLINSEWIHKRAKLRLWRRVHKTKDLTLLRVFAENNESIFHRETQSILDECELGAFIDPNLLPSKVKWKHMVSEAVTGFYACSARKGIDSLYGHGWSGHIKPFAEIDTPLLKQLRGEPHRNTILALRANSLGLLSDIHARTANKSKACRGCGGLAESPTHVLFECPLLSKKRTRLLSRVKQLVSIDILKGLTSSKSPELLPVLISRLCESLPESGQSIDIFASMIRTHKEGYLAKENQIEIGVWPEE